MVDFRLMLVRTQLTRSTSIKLRTLIIWLKVFLIEASRKVIRKSNRTTMLVKLTMKISRAKTISHKIFKKVKKNRLRRLIKIWMMIMLVMEKHSLSKDNHSSKRRMRPILSWNKDLKELHNQIPNNPMKTRKKKKPTMVRNWC